MFVRRFLLETKVGEMLLVFLERKIGLAVVEAGWLGTQRSGEPKAVREVQ